MIPKILTKVTQEFIHQLAVKSLAETKDICLLVFSLVGNVGVVIHLVSTERATCVGLKGVTKMTASVAEVIDKMPFFKRSKVEVVGQKIKPKFLIYLTLDA